MKHLLKPRVAAGPDGELLSNSRHDSRKTEKFMEEVQSLLVLHVHDH